MYLQLMEYHKLVSKNYARRPYLKEVTKSHLLVTLVKSGVWLIEALTIAKTLLLLALDIEYHLKLLLKLLKPASKSSVSLNL